MPTPQSFKNYTRWMPPFHFFVLPLLLLNFIFSIYATIHHWPEHRILFLWWIVMSIVLFIMAGLARSGRHQSAGPRHSPRRASPPRRAPPCRRPRPHR